MAKFITPEEAAALVADDATLVVGGFCTYGSPESLIEGLGKRYDKEGHPKNITIISGITPGDKTEVENEPMRGYNVGLNRLKADGLIGAAMIGLADARAIGYKIQKNQIAGYLIPMGILVNLFRATAGGAPGILTKVGLGTFCDPRIDGCAGNEMAKARGSVVELMEIDGQEYLFYKTYKPDVCFIRGTYADEDGNISIEHEVLIGAELEMAAATHNKGGTVIVQVGKMVKRGSIPPKKVRIHSKLVDYIVVAQEPAHQSQTFLSTAFRPELTGEIMSALSAKEPMRLDERKVIARRGAMELAPGVMVNLGVGMPAGVATVASEEGILDTITTTVESGPIGGVVLDGIFFPAVENAEAIYSQPDITNMYDGGLLDVAYLGAAEVDEKGNVNVSKFGGRASGPGGFINITQNAKKVIFIAVFTAGKPKPNFGISDSGLTINNDGNELKYVKNVQQITFSGDQAMKNGQEVIYISERCVFKLTTDGLELIEIAPGVDLEKDVLSKMEFKPIISKKLKTMDARIFKPEVMGLSANF